MFDSRNDSSRADKNRAVKAWTRSALRLHEDVSVLVSELTCTEPGCPPLETVIAVLEEGGVHRQFKVHRALADLSEEEVRRAVNRCEREESD